MEAGCRQIADMLDRVVQPGLQTTVLLETMAGKGSEIGGKFEELRTILDTPEAVGRKLDFLVQEMNREANTIGSKAQDVAIAQVVVDIKSEIEKIREQIQNIE